MDEGQQKTVGTAKSRGHALDAFANGAIILVSVLLAAILIKTHFFPAKQTKMDVRIPPGTKISLPGEDWKANGKTLVLALAKDCHFCAESAPFYRRVAAEMTPQKDLRLAVVMPQSVSESKEYLTSMGVNIADVRQAPLSSLGVRATPTLLLVDGNGAVKVSWVGKLRENEESEVLRNIQR